MSVYVEVRERDLWRCRACGKGDLLEAHHITYRSHGGTDTLDNLITLCKQCHMDAHAGHVSKEELHELADMQAPTLKLLRGLKRSSVDYRML